MSELPNEFPLAEAFEEIRKFIQTSRCGHTGPLHYKHERLLGAILKMTTAASKLSVARTANHLRLVEAELQPVDNVVAEKPTTVEEFESRFSHSDIITGAEYSLPSLRPIIKDENLNSNQRDQLIDVAEVTLKTVDYFLADHPEPALAPESAMSELTRYLDAGMHLPYAGRIDSVGENRLVPQPDIIFPPAQPGAYRFQGTVLTIKTTQGTYVPLTLLIDCLKANA